MPRTFSELLRDCERALVDEGGASWQRALLGRAPVTVDWPAELPKLTHELEEWFSLPPNDDHSTWRSASWAIEEHGRYRDAAGFRGSFVPFDAPYWVDVADGSIWTKDLDEDGTDVFRRTTLDLRALLESTEREQLARRSSPWRRQRIARAGPAPWELIDAAPASTEAGTALLASAVKGRYPKGQLFVAEAPGRWWSLNVHTRLPFDDETTDRVLADVRGAFADGGAGLEADVPDESVRQQLASAKRRGFELRRGAVRVWQRPSMAELLARFDRALARVAP